MPLIPFRLRCFALAFIGLLGLPSFAWLVLLSIGWREWWAVASFGLLLVLSACYSQQWLDRGLRGEL